MPRTHCSTWIDVQSNPFSSPKIGIDSQFEDVKPSYRHHRRRHRYIDGCTLMQSHSQHSIIPSSDPLIQSDRRGMLRKQRCRATTCNQSNCLLLLPDTRDFVQSEFRVLVLCTCTVSLQMATTTVQPMTTILSNNTCTTYVIHTVQDTSTRLQVARSTTEYYSTKYKLQTITSILLVPVVHKTYGTGTVLLEVLMSDENKLQIWHTCMHSWYM